TLKSCNSVVIRNMGSIDWKLADHPKLPKGKQLAVIILDRWGEENPDQYNCIHVADTPTMDSLKQGAPEKWTLVKAHGPAVGLPTEDDMGNSEVGHNALGAGRIFAQGLQTPRSKPKRESRRPGCKKINFEKRRDNDCTARQACNCAASFDADCAAIYCCCPCTLLHLLVLALVKLPSTLARKGFRCAKKKAQTSAKSDQKKKHNDGDDDEMRENHRYYTPPWSYVVSPQLSNPLNTSLSAKVDTDKVWSELYAAGHMGFGGSLFYQHIKPEEVHDKDPSLYLNIATSQMCC
ncbi:hypothetical protein KI387_043669, partial [Taxus chinensis]